MKCPILWRAHLGIKRAWLWHWTVCRCMFPLFPNPSRTRNPLATRWCWDPEGRFLHPKKHCKGLICVLIVSQKGMQNAPRNHPLQFLCKVIRSDSFHKSIVLSENQFVEGPLFDELFPRYEIRGHRHFAGQHGLHQNHGNQPRRTGCIFVATGCTRHSQPQTMAGQ